VRGVLGDLPGRYLHVSPVRIIFSCNQHGKPSFAVAFAGGGLPFNISHTARAGFSLSKKIILENLRRQHGS
jgi:phosphopantetheinyl transferase